MNLCAVVRQKSKSRHLVIAGGLALNSVMNGRILREAGFDDIYVMPAAGDNGTAIGAAFYVYNTCTAPATRICARQSIFGHVLL